MLQRDLRTYLKKALKVSNAKLRQLLTQSAEVGYNYDLSTLPTVRAKLIIDFYYKNAARYIPVPYGIASARSRTGIP